MLLFLLGIGIIFGLLIFAEWWWRRYTVHDEFSRKFVHITVGSFVAFWPFLMSWEQIRLLSLAFLIVIGLSKYFHVFKSIHSVGRPTWGEVFFALVVGLLTFITDDRGIYAAALLQMSLADGLAAIVGTKLGAANSYRILGHTKSVAGTFAFFAASLVILLIFASVTTVYVPLAFLICLALVTSLLENIAVRGLDNLLVPLLVGIVLAALV